MDSTERNRDGEERENLQGKEICGSQAIIDGDVQHLCHLPIIHQQVLSLWNCLVFGVNAL